MPSGGEGTQYNGDTTPPSTWFCDSPTFIAKYPTDPHCGTFVQILPYLEGSMVYKQINKDVSYRNDVNTINPKDATDTNYGSHAKISVFVCPANPLVAQVDPYGFGAVDYFATVYTDIDPISGKRLNNQTMSGASAATATDPWARTDGALALPAAPMSAISDGTSNTIMFVEDAGRTHATLGYRTASRYADPNCTGATGNMATDCTGTPGDTGAGGVTGSNYRAVNRWADPDATGSGISGPHQDTSAAYTALVAGSTSGGVWMQFVDQNANPNGGPTTCPWTLNNCGMNDEPFGWHPGGCNTAFADASVHFLGDKIDPKVMPRFGHPFGRRFRPTPRIA